MQIALAPMEGLVDNILRDVLTRTGGIDWCVTEFIRVTERLLPEAYFHKFAPELQHGAKTRAGVPLRVQLLGSGTILRESIAAQELLESDWGIAADVWSCPSFNELARDGQDAERFNLLHPLETPRVPYVGQQLADHAGPVIASTDYMKAYAEQIRLFIPAGRPYKVLGTDGYGRSDFRSKLREHFEINRHYIVVAALKALSEDGSVPVAKVAQAIQKYGIQVDKINPLYA